MSDVTDDLNTVVVDDNNNNDNNNNNVLTLDCTESKEMMIDNDIDGILPPSSNRANEDENHENEVVDGNESQENDGNENEDEGEFDLGIIASPSTTTEQLRSGDDSGVMSSIFDSKSTTRSDEIEMVSEKLAQENLVSAYQSICNMETKLEDLKVRIEEGNEKNVELQSSYQKLQEQLVDALQMQQELKCDNEKLRIENLELKLNNAHALTDKLENKEKEVFVLQRQVFSLKKQLKTFRSKFKQASEDYKKLCTAYESKILKLVQNLSVAEMSLSDTMKKLRDQETLRARYEHEARVTCNRFKKEKEHLEILLNQHINGTQSGETEKKAKDKEEPKEMITGTSKFKKSIYDNLEHVSVEERLRDLEMAHEGTVRQIEIIKKELQL